MTNTVRQKMEDDIILELGLQSVYQNVLIKHIIKYIKRMQIKMNRIYTKNMST